MWEKDKEQREVDRKNKEDKAKKEEKLASTGGKEDKFLPHNIAKKLSGKEKLEKEERERKEAEEK